MDVENLRDATVVNSLISPGCVVKSTVINSVPSCPPTIFVFEQVLDKGTLYESVIPKNKPIHAKFVKLFRSEISYSYHTLDA